jgi:GDP-L-fucose synthase
LVMRAVDLESRIRCDQSKPDGTPRKLMDSSRLFATGWRPVTTLDDGLRKVYDWYLATHGNPSRVRYDLSAPPAPRIDLAGG